MADLPPNPAEQSLITYPARFPIKVVGTGTDGFVDAIVAIAKQFDPSFDAASIETRPSRSGKYLGVTIIVTAISREQLDALYRALSAHPLVKFAL